MSKILYYLCITCTVIEMLFYSLYFVLHNILCLDRESVKKCILQEMMFVGGYICTCLSTPIPPIKCEIGRKMGKYFIRIKLYRSPTSDIPDVYE